MPSENETPPTDVSVTPVASETAAAEPGEPVVATVDRVAMAEARYNELADICRKFDPQTTKLRRQWDQEVKDRLNARAKERLRLVKQKGLAFNAWTAAKNGQADLEATLEQELADLDAARREMAAAERARIDRIDQLQREIELAATPVQISETPAAAIGEIGGDVVTAAQDLQPGQAVGLDADGKAVAIGETGEEPKRAELSGDDDGDGEGEPDYPNPGGREDLPASKPAAKKRKR